MKATGKNIESLRKRKNLSVKEIQEVFGFESPQAIYKWQWGDSLPTIDNLVVLATVFEVSIMNILVID
jgi:transcriptional regulator with XRE-family HTH domain